MTLECATTELAQYAHVGNPQDVLRSIAERHKLEPAGEPSLQNAIEMARSNMRQGVHLSHLDATDLLFQPSADTFVTGNYHHFWFSDHLRPRKHPRYPGRVRQGQDPNIHGRSRCRNEDLPGVMRKDWRYVARQHRLPTELVLILPG